MNLSKSDWLQRYRARLAQRFTHLTPKQLDELADDEAFEVRAQEYPDHPEKAADDEIDSWEGKS